MIEFGMKLLGVIMNMFLFLILVLCEVICESFCDISWIDWFGEGYCLDFGMLIMYWLWFWFMSGGFIGWFWKFFLWLGVEWEILEFVFLCEKILFFVCMVNGCLDCDILLIFFVGGSIGVFWFFFCNFIGLNFDIDKFIILGFGGFLGDDWFFFDLVDCLFIEKNFWFLLVEYGFFLFFL